MDGESPPYLLRYRERRLATVDGTGPAPRPFHLRRFHDVGALPPEAWHAGTSSPEIVVASTLSDLAAVDLHLVRHGETQSYLADAGLTPRGEWQSRRVGRVLAAEVADGETVRLLCAPTARASRTADQVRLGLEDGLAARGTAASVLGPETAPEFRNFQISTPSGPLDPTRAAGEYRLVLGRPEPGRPLWQMELGRFWVLQSGGGDPIEFWMTNPLLTFEPPSEVVRRFWAGVTRLAAGREEHTRVVCCTHSGPMRAFATWALGHDAGEPFNTEEVRVRIWLDRGRAVVTYRGRTQEIHASPLDEGAA
jgi:broad specificity phosphatase PhoE